MSEQAVLLYDDTCGFCRRAMRLIMRWDRDERLRAVPLQATEAATLLPGMSEAQRMDSWHLVTGGRVYSAGEAAAPLLRLLPGGTPLAAACRAFPRATERTYRWVANNRERLVRFLPKAGA